MPSNKSDRLIVAGHSHIVSLTDGVALRRNQSTPTLVPVPGQSNKIFGLHGGWPRTDNYWRALIDHASGNAIALTWQGNQHIAWFLIEQSPPFDFVSRQLPAAPLQKNAVIVPEALIRAKFRANLDGLNEVLLALKAQPCRLALIGTPPPQGDSALLRERLLSDKINRPAGLEIEQLRLTAPTIMLKLWHTLQDVYAEEASSAGVDFIPVPRHMVTDDNGFLKPEFDYGDLSHTNTAYGHIILEHVYKELSG